MTAIGRNTIRLKLDPTSSDDLVDAFTGASPIALRGLPLDVQFALYWHDTIADALSNISSITLLVKDKDTPEALSYISETLAAASLAACTAEQWTSGIGQHGTIEVSGADLDLPAAIYWTSVNALLTNGDTVRLAKGSLDLRVSGVAGADGAAFLTAAQGDARYMQLNLAGATFRASADGKHLYLWSQQHNAWREFFLDADDGFALGDPTEL